MLVARRSVKSSAHGRRWLTQAQQMRDEFSQHQCPGQECRRLLEAPEKTVGRSFLCLGFVVSQSVMPVEQFVYFVEQNALS